MKETRSIKDGWRKKQMETGTRGYVIRRAAVAVLFWFAIVAFTSAVNSPNRWLGLSRQSAVLDTVGKAVTQTRTFTFTDRVAYQRAIEEVYWRHRIWPKENASPKPALDAVMSQAQLETKVANYLHNSQALEDYWQRPLTVEDLQAEMDRMADNTKQPEVLRELFNALGNDPSLIAECLARPVLSERLITNVAREQPKGRLALSEIEANSQTRKVISTNSSYVLPAISDATTGCTPDTWTNTSSTAALIGRSFHTAVWTGSEMIVWGGSPEIGIYLNTGWRYDPSTNSWTATSITNAPESRYVHTAVWTGTEMIVWGGYGDDGAKNTGGKYNPGNDSWTTTSTTNVPEARAGHTAVWTGSEMIVWGGGGNFPYPYLNSGGRYNPSSDSWTATSTSNAPTARAVHTAVWTGTEMIVWGGYGDSGTVNTGGKYNPGNDSWTTTSTTNAPSVRERHTAVWTGSEMIVWGGSGVPAVNSGGRYNPSSDTWTATSSRDAPTARAFHTAVWTRSEMIVWGGSPDGGISYLNTAGDIIPASTVGQPPAPPTCLLLGRFTRQFGRGVK